MKRKEKVIKEEENDRKGKEVKKRFSKNPTFLLLTVTDTLTLLE